VQAPSIAVRGAGANSAAVYLSWNGATAVTQWRLLGGSSTHRLRTIGTTARRGFETSVTLPAPPAYLQAQALGAGGQVLASSSTVRG